MMHKTAKGNTRNIRLTVLDSPEITIIIGCIIQKVFDCKEKVRNSFKILQF